MDINGGRGTMNAAWLVLRLGLLLAYCNAELIITRPPRNATVLQDTRFLMHCEATGQGKPRIKWYHNEHEMTRTGQNYRIGSTGTLRFRDVKVSDRGEYHCKVETGRESLYSDPAYLVVQAEVEIIDLIPQSGKMEVEYGGSAILTCQAAGIPGPKIQWRINGESIIEEDKHNVHITETLGDTDKVLKSVLRANQLESSTKFECEAVNQHIGGVSVQAKTFEVIVRPKNDSATSTGTCQPYNGTACKHIHGTSEVFVNGSFEALERNAKNLLDEMLGLETQKVLRERCNGHGEQLICHYIFPRCDTGALSNFRQPKPVPVCRESCMAVQDLLCYVQWPVMIRSDVGSLLPQCNSTSLPSKWDSKQTCTEAGMFDREESEITSECYTGRGRWYNGTMNVTRSGKPCQMWSANTPQKHKRPPSVYRELENSENYCRNPGAEETSPWCYIHADDPSSRWELCEIPSCDGSGGEKTTTKAENQVTSEDSPALAWSTIVVIAVSSAGAVAIVLTAILCYLFVFSRQKRVRYKNTPQDDLEIDIQKLPANMSYHCVEEPIRLNPKLQAYEYPRNDILYIEDIGQGAFGRVFKAKAPNLTKMDDMLIAVKMLKEDASEDLQLDFEREATLMAEFDHPNIVKFLGVCAIGKPMCLLFEYMSRGDLNEYLRMCSPEMYMNFKKRTIQFVEGEMITLDITDQLDIARQISSGMMYLSEKSYVHRDLATRNCLIGENLTVKISDFGLARSVHRLEYYKGSDNDAIPIRWMPLESILYNKFSVESDVWSFGVLLWEIFSFALQPYYGMTHEEVVEYLKDGKNLVCPENTPQQVYNLMLKCWNRKPYNRPKFQMLFNALSALHNELTKKRVREVTVV